MRILNYISDLQKTRFDHWSANYDRRGSFPWYRETDPCATKQAAWEAALAWAQDYQRSDPYGNMADAFGVIRDENGIGWRGVINYFHSNT